MKGNATLIFLLMSSGERSANWKERVTFQPRGRHGDRGRRLSGRGFHAANPAPGPNHPSASAPSPAPKLCVSCPPPFGSAHTARRAPRQRRLPPVCGSAIRYERLRPLLNLPKQTPDKRMNFEQPPPPLSQDESALCFSTLACFWKLRANSSNHFSFFTCF